MKREDKLKTILVSNGLDGSYHVYYFRKYNIACKTGALLKLLMLLMFKPKEFLLFSRFSELWYSSGLLYTTDLSQSICHN